MVENAKNDLASLVADVREQVLYLKELGVESIDAKGFVGKKKAVSKPPDVVREAPPELAAPHVIQNQEPPLATSVNRQNLLEMTKLSRLSGLPSETAGLFTESANEPSMPSMNTESSNITIEPATESLLGDSAVALAESSETIEQIRSDIGDCRRCALWEGRTNIAHSQGNFNADLMFIGEAPGADEDAQAAPFVGRAGQLLTKIIEAIGFGREEVFIGNINRCRPPGNRAPLPDEVAKCKPYLLREIATVRPKVIVVLGNTACQNLLETKMPISKLRGIFQDYYGVKVMPTFHPAYLLRDPNKKREVWDDMKKVRDYLTANQ